MDGCPILRREVCRGNSAVGQFRLRFDPVAFLLEALAVFRGEGEAIRAVVAAAYAAIHVEVILHMCILGDEVDEAAVISKVAAVYRKAGVLIRAAAIGIAAVPVGIGEGTAQDPVIGNLAVIAELVVVVLVLDALRAVLRLPARHTSPDALAAFARTHFTQTFIHVVVFLTPCHEGKVRHAADRLVMRLNGSLDRRSIDRAIRTYLGKHFAGDDTILCPHFIGSRFITHFCRASELFQCGFPCQDLVADLARTFDFELRTCYFFVDDKFVIEGVGGDSTVTADLFNFDGRICTKFVAIQIDYAVVQFQTVQRHSL